jgi:hypothetical protein
MGEVHLRPSSELERPVFARPPFWTFSKNKLTQSEAKERPPGQFARGAAPALSSDERRTETTTTVLNRGDHLALLGDQLMASNQASLWSSFLGIFHRPARRPATSAARRPEHRRFRPNLECFEERVVPASSISSISAVGGNVGLGGVVQIQATFTDIENVSTAGGAPTISLTVHTRTGNHAGTASYFSGSGSDVLTFDYTVQKNDFDLGGILVTSPIVIPTNSSITDSVGDTPSLTFTNFTATNVNVDAVAPNVTSLTYNKDFNASAGTLSFDMTMTVQTVALPISGLTTSNFGLTSTGSLHGSKVASVSEISSSASGSVTTLTYKITVDVGNGIGGLSLFLIDSANSSSATIQDSFGNKLDTMKGTTNPNFPGSLVYASATTGVTSIIHNYHII